MNSENLNLKTKKQEETEKEREKTDKYLIEKIMQKKEFSQLPIKDVEIALEKFNKKPNLNEYQKVKLTRQLLRRLFSSFSSRKLLNKDILKKEKGKEVEWLLNKHKSTKERFPHYEEIYNKIFEDLNSNIEKNKETSVIDLGAGINGLTYSKMPENTNYIAIEAMGQFVDLMNDFFKEHNIKNKARAYQLSLFNIEEIKQLINKQKKPRIVILFKVIDSLELMQRDYSKKLINEVAPLSDKITLSFATKSLGNRKKFSAQRNWILKFIKENYNILNDFELGGERYIIFKK